MRSLTLIPLLICALLILSIPALAQNPYMSYYQYLTNQEITVFGEWIPLTWDEVFEGPIHCNDTLKIGDGAAVFRDTVSTSADHFYAMGGGTFLVDPVFSAPRVYFPSEATEIRELATEQGNFFDSQNGYYAHRLVLNGNQGWKMYWWPMGTPFSSQTADSLTGAVMQDEVIFVDGYLELYGEFAGRGVIGASGHPDPDDYLGYHCIRLLDDVRYWFADPSSGAFNDTGGVYDDMLTIVSESNITIGNTWANGRENMTQDDDIVITAALVALGQEDTEHLWGSLSFEDHNEPEADPIIWEWFTGNYSCPFPPNSDERGQIHLWGSLAQRRRGYIHRSNHNGTGYGWDRHYDDRFRNEIPVAGIKGRHQPVLEPASLHFENVPPYGSQTLPLDLLNSGGTYIDVETAHTNTEVFSLESVTPVSLIPGENQLYRVAFAPTAIGDYTDTLTIELLYGDDLVVPLTGQCTPDGITDPSMTPESWDLAAFPNPFNNELKIVLQSPALQARDIDIFDVTGQAVLHESVPATQHSFTWRPDDLSAGIYVIRIANAGQVHTQKVVYLK